MSYFIVVITKYLALTAMAPSTTDVQKYVMGIRAVIVKWNRQRRLLLRIDLESDVDTSSNV